METLALGPDTLVSQVLEASPAARKALRAHGIDTCCGGALSLAQAAEVRGIAVETLLGSLRDALAAKNSAPATPPAPPPLVGGADNVRVVLAKYPATHPVLERHGLLGCGGPAGPDERIDLFANVHKVPLETLLAELNAAARAPAPPRRLPTVNPPPPPQSTLYRRFLIAAILSTLTFGAAFGAYNLFAFHVAIGPVAPSHNWVHANFQVMGFVLLFTMGVAYHALPRFLGTELARPGLARATFWLAIAGLFVRTYGHAGEKIVPGAVPVLVVGSVLQLFATVGWGVVLAATWRRARPAKDLFHAFLASGTLWWIVAGGLLVVGAVRAVSWHSVAAAVKWHEPHYTAALFGGTLLWIHGMFLRTGPAFLGLRPLRRLPVLASFWLAHAGALLGVIGSALPTHALGPRTADVGLVLSSLAVILYAVGVRVFESPEERDAAERPLVLVLRGAFACAGLFAILSLGYAGFDLAGRQPSSLVYDGARHAFTLGFVTLMVFGMASRIVPVFAGTALRWPRLRVVGAALVLAGLALREAEVLAQIFQTGWLLNVSGASGIVAAIGVSLLATQVLGTVRAPEPHPETVVEGAAAVPIEATTNVARLIAAHPEALPILIEAGFAPLANPVLRGTLARAVTLAQACRMHGKDAGPIVEKIRAACTHAPVRAAIAVGS